MSGVWWCFTTLAGAKTLDQDRQLVCLWLSVGSCVAASQSSKRSLVVLPISCKRQRSPWSISKKQRWCIMHHVMTGIKMEWTMKHFCILCYTYYLGQNSSFIFYFGECFWSQLIVALKARVKKKEKIKLYIVAPNYKRDVQCMRCDAVSPKKVKLSNRSDELPPKPLRTIFNADCTGGFLCCNNRRKGSVGRVRER